MKTNKERRINSPVFYLLSLTWGLPMTLAGAVVVGIAALFGKRVRRFGPCFYAEIGVNWGGVELGMFFVKDAAPSDRIRLHEAGHSVQNIRFGFLMPFIVSIPSALRYWYRRFAAFRWVKNLPPYIAIWFERQADELGARYFSRFLKGGE